MRVLARGTSIFPTATDLKEKLTRQTYCQLRNDANKDPDQVKQSFIQVLVGLQSRIRRFMMHLNYVPADYTMEKIYEAKISRLRKII